MTASLTVERPRVDLFVDKTFEQSNLLTWNIFYKAIITRIQQQNAFHHRANRSMHFTVFIGLQHTIMSLSMLCLATPKSNSFQKKMGDYWGFDTYSLTIQYEVIKSRLLGQCLQLSPTQITINCSIGG